MAQRIREHDWTSTPLGPAEGWPGCLRVAVDIILAIPRPASILWGPLCIQIYNDAYVAIARDQHPALLGRPAAETWPEAHAEVFAPIMEAAFAGHATRIADLSITLAGPDGGPENRAFDTTWSPIRDTSDAEHPEGVVGGALEILVEVTERRRAEAAVRESEARHRLLAGNWAQAVWETDAGGNVVADSPSWRAHTGQTLAEWLGRGWLDAIHPDDRAYAERQWQEAVVARGLVDAEFHLRAPNGGWRWTNVRAAPVLDAAGQVEKWAGMNIDIDARKRDEAALRKSEAHSALLVRFADEVRGLSDPALVAEASCRILTERLGTDRTLWAVIDAEGRQYVAEWSFLVDGTRAEPSCWPLDPRDPFTREHLAGRPVVFDDSADDLRIPASVAAGMAERGLRAGIAVPVLVKGALRAVLNTSQPTAPRRWKPEEVAFVEALAGRAWAEIERARAEASLRGSEERFRAFAENSADTIWIASGDGRRLEYLSPAFERMFGEDRTRVMADLRRWAELLHPEDRDEAMRAMPRTFAGEMVSVHYRVVRPSDGRLVHLRDRGFPIRDEDGAIARVAGIVQDVSDLAVVGEALEAEKERFRTLAEGIPQLVWRGCGRGLWTWSSPQWQAYTGQTQEQGKGMGWLDAVHPDDRETAMAAWDDARSHGRLEVEYRVRRAVDGAWRWHQTRSVPVRNGRADAEPEGRILEWLGTTTDIEDLKRYQAEQAVLLAELQHRTRNLVTVTRNIAKRSFGPSPERNTYDERLAAVGRVQGFLARGGGWSVPLEDLIRAELTAVGGEGLDRITVEGLAVELPGDKAQTMALALHELATNAAKYGAIAQDRARLRVSWHVEGSGTSEARLVLQWHESGVAMPAEPSARRGYGSELIERALPYQLKAFTHREFTPEGVHCTIALPVDAFRVRANAP